MSTNTNSTSTSSNIVSMNSEALHSMQEGNYEEASDILLRALELTRSNVDPKPDSPKKISVDVPRDALVRDFPLQSVDMLGPTSTLPNDSVPPLSSCHGCADKKQDSAAVLSFYPRAFSVPYAPVTKTEKGIVLMVCVYNLGLARHLESLQAPSSAQCRTFQIQAAKLYESALKVANLHTKEESFWNVVRCLVLAATNNFAHLHAENCNVHEASKCISMMQSILSDPTVLRDLPEADYSFFEMNVITFLEAPLLSVAPAA